MKNLFKHNVVTATVNAAEDVVEKTASVVTKEISRRKFERTVRGIANVAVPPAIAIGSIAVGVVWDKVRREADLARRASVLADGGDVRKSRKIDGDIWRLPKTGKEHDFRKVVKALTRLSNPDECGNDLIVDAMFPVFGEMFQAWYNAGYGSRLRDVAMHETRKNIVREMYERWEAEGVAEFPSGTFHNKVNAVMLKEDLEESFEELICMVWDADLEFVYAYEKASHALDDIGNNRSSIIKQIGQENYTALVLHYDHILSRWTEKYREMMKIHPEWEDDPVDEPVKKAPGLFDGFFGLFNKKSNSGEEVRNPLDELQDTYDRSLQTIKDGDLSVAAIFRLQQKEDELVNRYSNSAAVITQQSENYQRLLTWELRDAWVGMARSRMASADDGDLDTVKSEMFSDIDKVYETEEMADMMKDAVIAVYESQCIAMMAAPAPASEETVDGLAFAVQLGRKRLRDIMARIDAEVQEHGIDIKAHTEIDTLCNDVCDRIEKCAHDDSSEKEVFKELWIDRCYRAKKHVVNVLVDEYKKLIDQYISDTSFDMGDAMWLIARLHEIAHVNGATELMCTVSAELAVYITTAVNNAFSEVEETEDTAVVEDSSVEVEVEVEDTKDTSATEDTAVVEDSSVGVEEGGVQ